MILNKFNMKGLFLIKPKPILDIRGSFRRNFCSKFLKKNRIKFNILQTNISVNNKKGTLRGFHYSINPKQESKIMTCILGEAFIAIVDLRKKSKTFLKKKYFLINDKNKYSLLIPYGFANAFITLKDNTIMHYYMNSIYEKKFDKNFHYDKKPFKIKWPSRINVLSKKDKNALSFNLLNCYNG